MQCAGLGIPVSRSVNSTALHNVVHHMYVHRNSYTCMAGSVCASSMALMVAIAGGISSRVAKQQTVAQITGRRPCLCWYQAIVESLHGWRESLGMRLVPCFLLLLIRCMCSDNVRV